MVVTWNNRSGLTFISPLDLVFLSLPLIIPMGPLGGRLPRLKGSPQSFLKLTEVCDQPVFLNVCHHTAHAKACWPSCWLAGEDLCGLECENPEHYPQIIFQHF